jgi:hypothetical protein
MTRFVLWGARAWDVQIKGFVWESLNEFRRLGWVAGPLRRRRDGW